MILAMLSSTSWSDAEDMVSSKLEGPPRDNRGLLGVIGPCSPWHLDEAPLLDMGAEVAGSRRGLAAGGAWCWAASTGRAHMRANDPASAAATPRRDARTQSLCQRPPANDPP